jgi:ABC-2 type transport system ATP-binding protein
MSDSFLQVKHLQKLYGTTVALADVDFEVSQGDIFGLLGPNGAGKTTVLSILSCLLEASGGEARLLGQHLLPTNREVRRQIGIVPQELAVYGELTARENLYFFGELYGLGGSTLAKNVSEVLAAVGLSDRADVRVDTFSGGMKRRLNLGAALVHQPQLLLLDEPTVGVDPQSRNHIFEEIRRVNDAGVTVIYTSHYMEEVQSLCNRVGIIDHGLLIACDTLSGLLKKVGGVIRFRVPRVTPALKQQIVPLSNGRVDELDGQGFEFECRDVRPALLRLVALLSELQLELISLETEEPNLERVFLDLTGRALRD